MQRTYSIPTGHPVHIKHGAEYRPGVLAQQVAPDDKVFNVRYPNGGLEAVQTGQRRIRYDI